MSFSPFSRMWERVEVGRQDSDTSLFMELMYLGEMVTKLMVAGLVAAIEDDRDRSRYNLAHALVRSDGVGDWAKAASELLVGPASRYLHSEARRDQKEQSEKVGPGIWQYEAVDQLHRCLALLDPKCEKLPAKVNLERWMREFARLRNKTRAHGAP